MLRVETVTAGKDNSLDVSLSNGRTIRVDLREYLDSPGYEGLRDGTVFSQVQVEEWGHGVEWPAIDQGINVDTLHRLAREQAGEAFPVADFNAWMHRNGLSLTTAAEALGVTRRTIVYYHGGHRTIPRYMGLACLGWEATEGRGAA
jgi:hypothetical protein